MTLWGRLNAHYCPAGPKGALTVLIFHRVHARPDPLFPLEPHARAFESKLRLLRRGFNVLPLPKALAQLDAGTLPAASLAITFDDGYADNRHVALPILRSLGLSATFFISTGFASGQNMWNDVVIESVRATSQPTLDLRDAGLGVFDLASVAARREAIVTLIAALKHQSPDARQAGVDSVARACRVAPCPPLMMGPDDIQTLHRAGMSLGAHTVTHPILARLTPQSARQEIDQSRRDLEHLIQSRVGLFAYPNGKPGADFSAEHVAMVKALGFDAALTTVPGLARAGADRFTLPRFTPWQPDRWRFGCALTHALRADRKRT